MTRNPVLHKLTIILLVSLPLIGVSLAVWYAWQRYVFAQDIAMLVLLYSVANIGVTIGYHRMLTHHGFDAPGWLRGLILICGCTAFEGAPVSWAATHIKHHAHSDEEGDPHSPLDGFWHAHFGWLFDLNNFPDMQQYAPHLVQDRVAMFVNRTVLVWMGLSLLIPYLVGGWTMLLWAGLVRIFLTTHVTWSVNSVCHTFGSRDFETTDESRNEWVVGLLAFGEGWHNNHHAFPSNAFHGMRWWQIDVSGYIIRLLEGVGLVWNVQRVSPETQEAQRQRAEQAKGAVADMRQQLMDAIANAKEEMQKSFWSLWDRSLTMEQKAQLTLMHDKTVDRLNEIQANVARAANLKRQRLAAYHVEVQKLATAASLAVQTELKRFAPQA